MFFSKITKEKIESWLEKGKNQKLINLVSKADEEERTLCINSLASLYSDSKENTISLFALNTLGLISNPEAYEPLIKELKRIIEKAYASENQNVERLVEILAQKNKEELKHQLLLAVRKDMYYDWIYNALELYDENFDDNLFPLINVDPKKRDLHVFMKCIKLLIKNGKDETIYKLQPEIIGIERALEVRSKLTIIRGNTGTKFLESLKKLQLAELDKNYVDAKLITKAIKSNDVEIFERGYRRLTDEINLSVSRGDVLEALTLFMKKAKSEQVKDFFEILSKQEHHDAFGKHVLLYEGQNILIELAKNLIEIPLELFSGIFDKKEYVKKLQTFKYFFNDNSKEFSLDSFKETIDKYSKVVFKHMNEIDDEEERLKDIQYR